MSKDFSEVRILVGQECGQIQGQILSAAWQKWRDKWANVKVLKAHPCLFIQILSQIYPDSIHFYPYFIWMRWMFFKNLENMEIKLKNLILSNSNPHFGASHQNLHQKVLLYMSFSFWLLSHVIFFKLREKGLLAMMSKFTKWQLFSLKTTT